MAKSPRARSAQAITLEGKPRTAMPVVVRNVPRGHNWGWYSREDPRMHLQTLDPVFKYKVWLEERGKRVFQPVGKIPSKVLKPLRDFVTEHREGVERFWVRFMLDQGWLELYVTLPKVTLVAYPNTPNKFVRVIDLTSPGWFKPELLGTLTKDNIALNREMASLRLWADRTEEQVPFDERLSTLLWTD